MVHNGYTRSVPPLAIEQLALGYKDHPDTLAILQEWARCDQHWLVRAKAIEQLAQGWQDQPWLFEFLCYRTLNDPFERDQDQHYDNVNPRKIALNAILKYYPNYSQTRSLLLDRAEHDSDPKLRKFALEKLAKLR
ncbi:HEAT repeat domain-containing protein [Moorena sp. SIO4G3]|uniref:HEAT repeat domain-containing protein n=1 Tax=Moorena sp. SIO4G3 TaxID=2607821 RepID=UPI0025DD6AB1|nr:HEAT repeat domain-containing protein [Moorena sp. SIO4G3]